MHTFLFYSYDEHANIMWNKSANNSFTDIQSYIQAVIHTPFSAHNMHIKFQPQDSVDGLTKKHFQPQCFNVDFKRLS